MHRDADRHDDMRARLTFVVPRLTSVVMLLALAPCQGMSQGVRRREAATVRAPAFPIVIDSACEGEDCEAAFAALACGGASLHAAPFAGAAIVARIRRGESLDVRRTDLHILRPGIVVLKRDYVLASDADGETAARIPRSDTLRFTAGDTVYLLRYLEVGAWEWWYHGRRSTGMEFWAGPADAELGGVTQSGDSTIAVGRSHPKVQPWWLVHRHRGEVGWWGADSTRAIRSIAAMQHWDEWCLSPSSTPPR